ncbi:MAG: ABC transporter permease subunit [Lachnospiraceae bacterium]|nr:ABC transporter permease subunit [Lachnospiraceae bacterium]
MKDKKTSEKKSILYKALSIATALLLWQLVALLVDSDILLVGPWQVLKRLFFIWREDGFLTAVGFSLLHIFGGFLLGIVLGLILACLAARYKAVKIFLWPYMACIKSVPVASFVVICLVWLSPARLSVFISFLIVLPIMYQNTLTAIEGLDKSLTDLAKLEKLSYPRALKEIFLPSIAPQIKSSTSLCAGIAWKAGIAAEVIGTPHFSIGRKLYLAKTYLATDDLLAWTVIVVLVSILFEKLFVFVIGKILGESD